jgi:hypothetical protein
MIPRRFFWLFDLLVLIAAFLAARALVPRLAPLFAPGGPLRTPWLEALTSPAIWRGQLPPLAELLWILLVMAPSTLLMLSALGNYGPLLYQSRTRITVGSFLASLQNEMTGLAFKIKGVPLLETGDRLTRTGSCGSVQRRQHRGTLPPSSESSGGFCLGGGEV